MSKFSFLYKKKDESKKMSIYSKLQANGNYLQVNKTLIQKLGLEEAILLSEFANEENYWEKEHKLNKDKYFFSTVDNIERTIGFKIDKQRKLIKSLEKKNIINVQYRDLPRKRYVRINDKKIFELL